MKELPLALTFDDVLLVPRRSRIRSRADVATRTQLTRRIALEIPVVSANMDTVTTAPMAIALAQLGGIGVLHRFLSVEDEVAEVARVKRFRTRVIADPHTIEAGATLADAREPKSSDWASPACSSWTETAGWPASSRHATCAPATSPRRRWPSR